MTEDQYAKKSEFLDNQLKMLETSFDSVLVLCTKYDGGTTHFWIRAHGNYHANLGLAQYWLDDERDHSAARND
jgi:hypothetical protein